MRPSETDLASVPAQRATDGGGGRPVLRFTLHLMEMCVVMCLGAVAFSLLAFGSAALLGYTRMPERLPELSAVIVALALSLPMLAWMRFRAMAWRPTLEMSLAPLAVGLLAIGGYWIGMVSRAGLIEVQVHLACPIMFLAMVLRFRLYSGGHGHSPHQHLAHT